MYIKALWSDEKMQLKQRANRIKELQEEGVCFGCYNFKTEEIFSGEGLIIYEDDKIRCQFERFPRLKGETSGFENFVKEDGILMDYHETVEIYKEKMKELL